MPKVIEGHNFSGKDSTIDIIKKKHKNWVYTYHPRFLDPFYKFSYSDAVSTKYVDIPGSVVTQVGHLTCLKYLEGMEKTHTIIANRNFISEMVYNYERHDRKFYEELCNVLKEKFDYHIYYLFVSDDEELKRRIRVRFEEDRKKKYGNADFDLHNSDEEEAILGRFNLQRNLHKRYEEVLTKFPNCYTMIDTSGVPKEQVAKQITKKE